eukprot:comp12364_c0_seq1/m.7249 comp12364_c0_seq1/g.7249  ORF comp12364_c0_seq1/g.7249 comp12364_c0_seq1/m.7249 type:complete len:335 (-) comp12364_c0_seq1:468-1472(-)
MEGPLAKKAKKMPTIGTHSGTFHADEAMACFLLHQTQEFADAPVVRSRDPAVLDTCDILVDVGAVYDPTRHRYDHHQRGFTEVFSPNHKIKLSSAGLIYKHFGREIVKKLAVGELSEADLELIYQRIYDELIEGLDGVDNGVSQYPTDITPAYKDSTNYSARVGRLNPAWNEENVDMDGQFRKAMALAGEEFTSRVKFLTGAWLPARSIVAACLNGRFEVDPSGRIAILDSGCPWKDHLFMLEEEAGLTSENNLLYLLFPDSAGSWRVQAVPLTPSSFELRKAMPEPWRGLRDDALSAACGIPGGVFIHANGFIGGMKTKEGALALAKACLNFA